MAKAPAPKRAKTHSIEDLSAIHDRVGRLIAKRLDDAEKPPIIQDGVLLNPPLSAAELTAISKFLKDNNIAASLEGDHPLKGRAPAAKMPFPVEGEDPKENAPRH